MHGLLLIVLGFLVLALLVRLWHRLPWPKSDPALGDPEAKRLLVGLKKRQDWPAVHAFLQTQRDWWERAFYVKVLGEEINAGDDAAWLEDDFEGRSGYFQRPDVQAELRDVHDRMVRSPAWVEPTHLGEPVRVVLLGHRRRRAPSRRAAPPPRSRHRLA